MLGLISVPVSSDPFIPDVRGPVVPGKDSPILSAVGQRSATPEDEVRSALIARAERERERAKCVAADKPSSTTFAALAQTHAALGERDEALAAARSGLSLSLELVSSSADPPQLADPAAARVATEVMLRFGAAEDAFSMLREAPLPRSLRITLATLAVDLDRPDVAMEALQGQEGAMVESFRGFLLVAEGKYQKAIPHLRAALRDSPEDVAAAMNLSASLWAIGSRRKAVSAALRASRAAPGRKDASLHYLDLLLEVGDVRRLTEEISMLNGRGVIPDAHFFVVQARALIAKGEVVRALPLLDKATAMATSEGNEALRGEIQANLAVLKYRLGRWSYKRAIDALSALVREHPDNAAVVVSFARISDRTTEAPVLRAAVDQIGLRIDPALGAFLRYQLASLEGDNEAAASAASEWFELDTNDPLAAASALIELGIGVERWQEAEKIAEYALEEFPDNMSVVNNASYILAMAGKPLQAIRALEPWAADDYVLKATLGLAHLANGDTDDGMRLYRQAAGEAERASAERLSLMVAYQALVVRQLGIDEQEPPEKLAALALAPVPLPADWERRPEFVRLRNLSRKRGYAWPLTL